MGNWRRRYGSEIPHHQLLKSPRNPSPDNWHAGVPSWEKKFCSSVGLISWKKLLDTKKCMYLYDNVVKWNDSAGEEAFHNAKSRFWAEINGLPCDISLPDPDIYIDEIDWNCNVDPDLMLDLEREQIAPVREGDVVIASLYEALGLYQSYTCVGWGEAKEDLQKPKAEPGNCDQKVDDGQNSWEMSSATKNNVGLRDEYLNNSVGWNDWGNNHTHNPSYNQNHNHKESDNRFTNRIWRTCDVNCKNSGGNWYHSSTFKGSRFHYDGYQKENGWRNSRRGGRKRVNFAHEPNNSPECWKNSNPNRPVNQQWSSNGINGVRRNQFCEY
ncbi:uncharacterized protein LOC101209753 isoform X1 [Cucumis sativus]|uniref:Uncharacterized protein n=2 Tax=Cucumis sativus TaxID=3659 RepID=A0A0A0LC07_CUCSA|nr:uncharacterized protein LOC101209753 isoform X1 [Cucumis sativus]XP_031737613.1 uncharacterized protein LOC101209753 isoform X1 [Cucumis sativus]XP_031737614.1 uncharacterized protein LOC101209753 isoform X1 [Cucumis sativus]